MEILFLEGEANPMGGWGMIVYFVVLIAIFYFFMIRPQKKKEKQTKAMLDAVQVGDDILTIGGMYGTVTKIKDDKMLIEISKQDKTVIEIARWAIKDVIKYVEDK